ncbi:MAG: zinc dependent phospholipase C family protein [Faecalibacterium sp.]|jgi:hypothetical protein|nr:zinc dependent phospholipase C family protein [Faecalibacterium sp.]
MPEGYVHAKIALAAADEAGWQITDKTAFLAGATGPDILYCFEGWKRPAKRRMDLAEVGRRLHVERTGAFLHALCDNAVTPLQKDYFLGFLCHYAVDTVVHPYVVAVTKCCPPYAGKSGHGKFEIALDSFIHKRDTGNAAVPVDDISPLLTGAPLAELGAQLQKSLKSVYGLDIEREYLADAFFDNHRLRGLFATRNPLMYLFFWLAEPFVGGRGTIFQHVSPAKLRGLSYQDTHRGIALPTVWRDPFTHEVREEDIHMLLLRAQARATELMQEATAPFTGYDMFWPAVGSLDYIEGRATARSAAPAVSAEQEAEPEAEQELPDFAPDFAPAFEAESDLEQQPELAPEA